MITEATHTATNLTELPNMGGDAMQARFAAQALGLETIGLSLQRLEPGQDHPFPHRHAVDEEVYLVLHGSGEAIVDDARVPLAPMTALRVAPRAVRTFTAGDDGLEFLAFGTHTEGDGEIVSA